MKMHRTVDVNCDLGEGEPRARTRALMRWITSANIACGGHAGSVDSMRACVRAAKQLDVRVGAHPGPWSRDDRGRGAIATTPVELTLLLLHQIGALAVIAAGEGVRLHHVKLHGGLYHAVESDARLTRAYLDCVSAHWPRAAVYALAGGRVARAAQRAGVRCLAEAFADRAYRRDGSLVSRTEPGALVDDVDAVEARVSGLTRGKGIAAVDGTRIMMRVDTICVHSDTPGAVRIARAVSQALGRLPRSTAPAKPRRP